MGSGPGSVRFDEIHGTLVEYHVGYDIQKMTLKHISTCAYVVVWVGGLEVWELMIL